MTETECLNKMVPPGKIRPGKMGGGGVVQIHLTRACSLSCFNCTQLSNLRGPYTFMSLENFEKAVLSLQGYFGLVALFGGQPSLHPKFPKICEILVKHVPIEKRGLWTNALNGHGAVCRETFLPKNCNLNVHLSQAAYDEFKRDWPESNPFGLHEDSRHSSLWAAMRDVSVPADSYVTEEDRSKLVKGMSDQIRLLTEGEIYALASGCDINRDWSPLVGEFRGELRAWWCEIAGAQAMIHQHEPDYPDTGLDPTVEWAVEDCREHLFGGPTAKWWQLGMHEFRQQVGFHCFRCGVPLRGHGELAQATQGVEQVSAEHDAIYKPKRPGREVQIVTEISQLGKPLEKMTKYIQNSKV